MTTQPDTPDTPGTDGGEHRRTRERQWYQRFRSPAAMAARRLSALVFTTGEVAAICQVAPRTVSKWFDSGRLRGYRIPGGDRRVPREQLLAFLRQNGMPQLALLEGATAVRVLLAGLPGDLARRLLLPLMDAAGAEATVAPDVFAAGLALGAAGGPGHWAAVLVDAGGLGRGTALALAATLRRRQAAAAAATLCRRNGAAVSTRARPGCGASRQGASPAPDGPRLVALLPEDDPGAGVYLQAGYDAALCQPCAPEIILQEVLRGADADGAR